MKHFKLYLHIISQLERVSFNPHCCLSFPRNILESHSSVWTMTPLSQISSHINSTCGAENSTGVNRARPHAYYALSYCALILAIIFGNGLVCAAVLRERALQTTTNYLVVSLAVADLLVATLVMPWVVYLEVSGLVLHATLEWVKTQNTPCS